MFQFLIGSLKTEEEKPICIHQRMFQFLIGSLKTGYIYVFTWIFLEFQFLIGSLKTRLHLCFYMDFPRVSIPYR